MDLQAQLALKGIKIQNFHQRNDWGISDGDGCGGYVVTYSYKWVTATGEVRWDYGFVIIPEREVGVNYESLICKSILDKVDATRESLKGKTPEVL